MIRSIIAVTVTTEGRCDMIGLGLGPSEAEPFWSTFLKGLIKRGLKGVKLVISDAYDGLRHAITACSVRHGKGAACIGRATPWRTCLRASTPWSPPQSARPSCKPMPRPRVRPGDMSLENHKSSQTCMGVFLSSGFLVCAGSLFGGVSR